MSICHRSAETLLQELGISEPRDLDIEAIAYYCGAVVRYRPLTGCAARIIGGDDRAIITIDNGASSWPRQRFSIGHELGHWMRDRGKSAHLCQDKDLTTAWGHRQDPESRANQYAADLLLPAYMFKPLAAGREMTFRTVRALAEEFQMSLTATAIRLVEKGAFPALLACYGIEGRRWFSRGPDVPNEIWPPKQVHHDTTAFEVLFGGKEQRRPVETDADAWIEHRNAHRYTVIEDSVKIADDAVLTIIWWKNERQLVELARF